jgi:UPF0716 protein FxsA
MRGIGLFVFLVLPIAEIIVIIQVAHVIGGAATAVVLLGTCLVGAAIVRRAGARAWAELQQAAATGRPPRDVVDGAIVLLGGVLLLVPGFITDVVGLFLLIPVTRRLTRWMVAGYVGRRVRVIRTTSRRGGQASPYGDVIEGEVVDEETDVPPKRDRPDQIGRAG